MTAQICFFGAAVAAVILQRLFELRLSRRNEKYLLQRCGGQKHHENLLPAVIALQVAWFLAMGVEVIWLDRPFRWYGTAIPGLVATAAGQCLRCLSIRALGRRWTLPLITVPQVPPIRHGIYRYGRHPNWLGVLLETAGLPMVHTAYWTATAFTIANAILLAVRIRAEERVLWGVDRQPEPDKSN